MEDSILKSIKKLLGLDPEYTVFDMEIIIHINSVFSVLHQLGAELSNEFIIEDDTAKWSDFIGEKQHIQLIKTYMYLKVRLVFDLPGTSFAIAAFEKQAAELEWRISILEIIFNPNVYGPPTPDAYVYEIDDGGSFPEDAEPGDVGIDPDTGNLWREE
jgi:hypothetical protein